MKIKKFDDKYAGTNALEEFTPEEGAAFAELATLVVLSDRNVSSEELQTLVGQFIDLAFDGQQAAEAISGDPSETVRQRVERLLEDEDSLKTYVRETAAKIEEGGKRETVLDLLATLAYADGLEPSEKDVCYQIGRAFGFPRELVQVTFDEIRKGHG